MLITDIIAPIVRLLFSPSSLSCPSLGKESKGLCLLQHCNGALVNLTKKLIFFLGSQL
jgi:hypothetical protein